MTTTLRRTVLSSDNDGDCGTEDAKGAAITSEEDIFLIFLGCEALPPYGPYDHTALLFLDLIACAVSDTLKSNHQCVVVLEVYAVSEEPIGEQDCFARFPSDEDLTNCDGVIVPGSLSSAYDEEKPWILALKDWIQKNLVARSIPTLGVCFGHQMYAHSFAGSSNGSLDQPNNNGSVKIYGGGIAVQCPAGPQAGRKTTELTATGQAFLNAAYNPAEIDNYDAQHNVNENSNNNNSVGTNCINTGLDLFYTHGDMVESLPSQGVSLGGNERVPIQAAIYFSAPVVKSDGIIRDIIRDNANANDCDDKNEKNTRSGPKVIAVTFQAHPEFASLGKGTKGDETLHDTMKLMKDKGNLSEQDFVTAEKDAASSVMRVREQSLKAMISAGRLLGWFRKS